MGIFEVNQKINVGAFNVQKYDYGGHVKAWHTERDSIHLSHRVSCMDNIFK